MFSLGERVKWRQDQLRHKVSESSCVRQSLFRVAPCSSNARQGTVWISLRCLNPPVTAQGPNAERGYRCCSGVSHVGLLLKRGEGAPWAVFLSSREDPIRSQFGGGHLGPLDGWPGGGDKRDVVRSRGCMRVKVLGSQSCPTALQPHGL